MHAVKFIVGADAHPEIKELDKIFVGLSFDVPHILIPFGNDL